MSLSKGAKMSLFGAIADNMHARDISQRELADLLGTTESRVSHMMNGRHRLFSLEYLLGCCETLGMKVSVEVK